MATQVELLEQILQELKKLNSVNMPVQVTYPMDDSIAHLRQDHGFRGGRVPDTAALHLELHKNDLSLPSGDPFHVHVDQPKNNAEAQAPR